MTRFSTFVVPLPPLAEQHRIATKVDGLMRLCDELEAQQQQARTVRVKVNNAAVDTLLAAETPDAFADAWHRLRTHFDLLYADPANVAKLKQAILQLAVQGKLVPQDPNDEPASVLLERVAAEKARLVKEGKIRNPKKLPPIAVEEVPYELPPGWTWARLGDIGKEVEYGTSQKASIEDIGVPMLRMNNIDNGQVVLKKLKYVRTDIDDLPRLYLKHNDLLFNRTNSYELVGKTGVFKGEDNSATFASYLIRVSFLGDLTSVDFVNLYMNAPVCRLTQIEPEITQQTGQANFNGTKLKNIRIPVAPIQEQHRIVAKVDHLLKHCDELEARLRLSQDETVRLMEAVLHRAFMSQSTEEMVTP